MTIKRKTQLNLSGSHHNVDADIAWVGSNLYVTGSSQFTGSAYFQHITGSISGTLGGLPFIVAGPNITASYNDSTGQWAFTGSSGGSATPAGADRTVQFNNNGAFAGDIDFQFYSNSLGNIGANTLAFPSGTVGVLSGSNIDNQAYTLVLSAAAAQPVPGGPIPGFFDPAVVVLTPVVMSQSLMLFDGQHDPLRQGGEQNFPGGGVALANESRFTLYSGSWSPLPSGFGGKDPVVTIANGQEGGSISVVGSMTVQSSSTDQNNIFSVRRSVTAGQVELKNVGAADFVSGAVNLTYGSTLNVHSGSLAGVGFAVVPDTTAGTVKLDINGRLFSNGTNISALTGSVKTGGAHGEPDSNIMSGSLLTAGMVNGSVGKFRVEVVGADIYGAEFIAADLIVAASKSVAGVYGTFGVTEVTLDAVGTYAPAWDVNINPNGDIAVTSSSVGVDWYAQVSKKMILSGSGIVIY